MINKNAFTEFLMGAGFVIGVVAVGASFLVVLDSLDYQPIEKFKVVDNYRGCDVVRFSPPDEGRYTYFLDCKPKP